MQQTVPHPPDLEQQETAPDRRIAKRHESGTQTYCFASGLRMVLPVSVLNVSRTGLGLLTDSYIRSGEPLVFDIPANGALAALMVRGEVVRCIRYSPENWLVGYEFDTPLTATEFRTLLSHWP
jgi:hypothetical protein